MRDIKTTGLTLLLLVLGGCAQAESEPKVITLSCDGTLTYTMIRDGRSLPEMSPPREQIKKVDVVVNLDERMVSFLGYRARIGDIDAAHIKFGERPIRHELEFGVNFWGEIDRVTGRFDATAATLRSSTTLPDYNALQAHYEMLCKKTNRGSDSSKKLMALALLASGSSGRQHALEHARAGGLSLGLLLNAITSYQRCRSARYAAQAIARSLSTTTAEQYEASRTNIFPKRSKRSSRRCVGSNSFPHLHVGLYQT